MDFGTLANLSNPGTSPTVDGTVSSRRIHRWNTLNNTQLQALQGAKSLADLDLQKQQQATQEYMAGAQGRNDTISLGNLNAAANLKGFDEAQIRKKLEEKLKDSNIRAELEDFTKDIGQFGDGYINGTDEEKQTILNSVKGRKLRNGYVMGTDPAQDKTFLMSAGLSRKYNPKEQTKRDVAATNVAGKISLENLKNLNRQEQIELQGRIRGELAQASDARKAATTGGKPTGLGARFAQILDQHSGGDPQKWVETYIAAQTAGKLAGIDAAEAGLRLFNIDVPPTQLRPVPPAAQPATPQQPKQIDTEQLFKRIKGTKVKLPNGVMGEVVGVSKDGTQAAVKAPSGSIVAVPIQNNVKQ